MVVDVVRKKKEPVKPLTKQKRTTARKNNVQQALRRSGFKPNVDVSIPVMDFDTHFETERCIDISFYDGLIQNFSGCLE